MRTHRPGAGEPPEALYREGQSPHAAAEGRATLAVHVQLDAVPVLLRDRKPVDQVACKGRDISCK